MRRFVAAMAVLTVLMTAGPARAQKGAKPRVAILEFKDKVSGYSWYQAGRAAQDIFVTELVKTGAYRVIEREQLAAIMAEKNLSLSGEIDPKTAIAVGKLLGVEYLVTGSITKLGVADRGVSAPSMFGLPSVNIKTQKMEAAIDARAIGTATGEIVWADSAKESTSDAAVFVAGAGGGVQDRTKLDRVMEPVVKKLAESLGKKSLATSGLGGAGDASGIVAKVARVEGSLLYINAGSEAGVKEGEEYDVYRGGDVIKDPDTGEILGVNETKIGRVKITGVKGPRLSTVTVLAGQGFKSGDILKK
ncbi:MAG: hypothetical protein IT186_02080 [Acidobacteria bacterium]|nr:hypothetical protein [Acidobacteriota bacterium]MCG3192721.1 hypothetical protein [Thermoanaerobaculia bacterium]